MLTIPPRLPSRTTPTAHGRSATRYRGGLRRSLAAALGTATLLPLTVAATTATAGPAAGDTGAELTATPTGDWTLDEEALFFVSYDGLVNNGSYQQSGILTYGGHQYAAWYTSSRHAVIARRSLAPGPGQGGGQAGEWETVQLPHQLTRNDSHNSISLGISASDGRLHVAMDTHDNPVFYTRSAAGLAEEGSGVAWSADAFGPIERGLGGTDIGSMTYPRFIPTPDGDLQFSYRTGGSGDGALELAEYVDGEWNALGAWSSPEGEYRANGAVSTSRNMYLHGIGYDADGRLHASFTWRESAAGGDILCHPGGLSNHDTGYVYSDDRGRTWRTDDGVRAAVTGTSERISVDTPNHVVDPLPPDYALMNQESQAVDSGGNPHVVISYRPGRFGHCSTDFVRDRQDNGYAFHLHRDEAGSWHKIEIPEPLRAFGRSRLVLTGNDDAYVVLPFGRVMAASAESGWTDWRMVHGGDDINAFGEVLVDESRVASEGVLSIFYQEPGQGTTPSPIRVTDLRLG